ncbi:enoyl-CoA hydratase-related protein [Massilia cavernae]|uniref:enoyl-CoA hydratase-related protein n=1 Tax=Massilia cavernae TaxID=2320864 RepID=UPI001C71E769|nr:enoyl-CoA hydratase-related protein [Massilia cavernae]
MSYKYLLVSREDRLTVVTINRPEAFNSLNAEAHLELEAVFDNFAADTDQWVAILTGAGSKAFCAGHDLKQQASGGGLTTPKAGFAGLASRADLVKPVIAAVNGAAMGGGFEAALACDILVAAEHATFALPEPKVGLAALAGGIQRLPRELGLKQAMGMMLTGRAVTAQQGYAMGFVNEVVSGDVLEAARRWAADILACSPLSVRATKEAILKGLTETASDGMRDEWNYPSMKAMLESEDAVEGPERHLR